MTTNEAELSNESKDDFKPCLNEQYANYSAEQYAQYQRRMQHMTSQWHQNESSQDRSHLNTNISLGNNLASLFTNDLGNIYGTENVPAAFRPSSSDLLSIASSHYINQQYQQNVSNNNNSDVYMYPTYSPTNRYYEHPLVNYSMYHHNTPGLSPMFTQNQTPNTKMKKLQHSMEGLPTPAVPTSDCSNPQISQDNSNANELCLGRKLKQSNDRHCELSKENPCAESQESTTNVEESCQSYEELDNEHNQNNSSENARKLPENCSIFGNSKTNSSNATTANNPGIGNKSQKLRSLDTCPKNKSSAQPLGSGSDLTCSPDITSDTQTNELEIRTNDISTSDKQTKMSCISPEKRQENVSVDKLNTNVWQETHLKLTSEENSEKTSYFGDLDTSMSEGEYIAQGKGVQGTILCARVK